MGIRPAKKIAPAFRKPVARETIPERRSLPQHLLWKLETLKVCHVYFLIATATGGDAKKCRFAVAGATL